MNLTEELEVLFDDGMSIRIYNAGHEDNIKDGNSRDAKGRIGAIASAALQQSTAAVLGTQNQNGPYGSLVAFQSTNDLKHLLFATARSTRKYDNLMKIPHVSMVIDNRSNNEMDFHEAIAVTAIGDVMELGGLEEEQLKSFYLAKHPGLLDFVQSSTCALLKVEVKTYYIVRQFQKVTELHIAP